MNFQLRHNLLITIFIIVIIATMWLMMKGLSYSFDLLNTKATEVPAESRTHFQEVAYIENS